METALKMNDKKIENLAEATNRDEAVNKHQVDTAVAIINNNLNTKADKSYVDCEIAKIPHKHIGLF